jgi:23S rRNA (pseudouridine1915-N3)-methyltransferase
MHVAIIAVGRMKAGPERELIARYQKRFALAGKNLGLSGPDIIEISESKASSSELRKSEEAKKIVDAIPDGAFVIALDEHGKNISSTTLSQKVLRIQEDGNRAIVFLIGGADGHGDLALKRANLTLSFGQLTWPHQIVRLLLVEQLYRITTIQSGHPYHRT